MVTHSEAGGGARDRRPHQVFNQTMETFAVLVRGLYRDVVENITGEHPRVYRQVSAGCQVGLVAVPREWPVPAAYRADPGRHPLRAARGHRSALHHRPADEQAHRRVHARWTRTPSPGWSSTRRAGSATRPWSGRRSSSSTSSSASSAWEARSPTSSSWPATSRSRPGRTPSTSSARRRRRWPASATCRPCSTTTPRTACWSPRCPPRTASATSATSRRWPSPCTTWRCSSEGACRSTAPSPASRSRTARPPTC